MRAKRRFNAATAMALLAGLAACSSGGSQAEGGSETRSVTLPAGTELEIQLGDELSTETSKRGDTFTGTVTAPVTSGNLVAIPAGSTVRGEVTAVQQAGDSVEADVLKLAFKDIQVRDRTYPLDAKLVEAHPEKKSDTSTGEAAAKVGAGAAAGAILGRIIGGDAKGTLIGAAVGAATGTAIVLGTRDTHAVLPRDSMMRIRLEGGLRIDRPTDVAESHP